MADPASRISDLKADFQRIADRANWVRAGFTLKEGRFGMYMLGPPVDDGTALVSGIQSNQELAIMLELLALTDQAGSMVAKVYQSDRGWIKTDSSKPFSYDLRRASDFWFVFLLHTPPVCFQCQVKAPDGDGRIAFPHLGKDKSEQELWIDNYPQVCVSALTWLKTSLFDTAAHQQTPKTPAKLPNAKRDSWVARQRAKKSPPSWEQIYDEGVRLAPNRGWNMPGSSKALQEAYRRHLRRQRTGATD
jgi:hypothetical protein